ncbi:MAG: holliday junction DNA helicase [Planctomycetota bacterium]|nr:MAG: holliday junction DNA helicase [Planctomycetota bacterium]
MFESFTGELSRKTPGTAVVECGGVGYALRISLATYDALPAPGARVRIWAHLESGGDAGIRLFGFATETERQIFRLLLNVNGVGPSTALTIVSGAPLEDLRRAVADGDVATLKRIKGVGPKTAQRLARISAAHRRKGRARGGGKREKGCGGRGDCQGGAEENVAALSLGLCERVHGR